MKCPTCGAWSEVTETREAANGLTRRARRCANEHRFMTFEVLPQVIKAAGQNVAATARAAQDRVARWRRDHAIARDLRPAAQVARDHGITEARVRQIRAAMTAATRLESRHGQEP